MTTEEWKIIDGYEGRYAVSNTGKVRREHVRGPDGRAGRFKKHSLLAAPSDGRGYPRVYLWNRDTRKRDPIAVHRLVAIYFIGSCPSDKDEVNHIDGNPQNNYVENLEWVTHSENILHAFRELGRTVNAAKGSMTYNAKLAEEDIPKIRQLIQSGLSTREIGRRFGVSHAAIMYIKKGTTWKHVK